MENTLIERAKAAHHTAEQKRLAELQAEEERKQGILNANASQGKQRTIQTVNRVLGVELTEDKITVEWQPKNFGVVHNTTFEVEGLQLACCFTYNRDVPSRPFLQLYLYNDEKLTRINQLSDLGAALCNAEAVEPDPEPDPFAD